MCRAAPGKCPLTTSDGRPAPHYRTREEAAEHAATGFPAFTKTTPQWALEENALKHPVLDVKPNASDADTKSAPSRSRGYVDSANGDYVSAVDSRGGTISESEGGDA